MNFNDLKINELIKKAIEKKEFETLTEILSGDNVTKDTVVSHVDESYLEMERKTNAYDELYDKYLRQMAEYDNFRKRTLKEKEELRLNGHQKAVETLFPIIDDFERALDNISEDAKEGVQLIYNKFISTLQTLGVEPIVIENNITNFNDNEHEAILMVKVDDEELNGKVIDCVQTGYKLNGKIIRHPKVVVGEFKY